MSTSTGEPSGTIRTFATGATRDTDNGKLDYEAFLSPLVLKRFAEYMHLHRKQADGTMRPGDNWQKGIPIEQYMKSRWRHFIDTWTLHRQGKDMDDQQETNLCAEIFNAMGQLHEILKAKGDPVVARMQELNTARTRIEELFKSEPPYKAEDLEKEGLNCLSNQPPLWVQEFGEFNVPSHLPAGKYNIWPKGPVKANQLYLSFTGEKIICPRFDSPHRIRHRVTLCSASTK